MTDTRAVWHVEIYQAADATNVVFFGMGDLLPIQRLKPSARLVARLQGANDLVLVYSDYEPPTAFLARLVGHIIATTSDAEKRAAGMHFSH